MSTLTPNLGLFKYDVTNDSQTAFSITNALNNNWDKLDNSIIEGNIIELSGTNPVLTANRIHKITCNGNTTFSLPNGSVSAFKQMVVLLYMESVYSINLGTSVYFNGTTPNMSSTGYYTIIYEWDNLQSCWAVGVLKK